MVPLVTGFGWILNLAVVCLGSVKLVKMIQLSYICPKDGLKPERSVVCKIAVQLFRPQYILSQDGQIIYT
jgi:hypothetical protein